MSAGELLVLRKNSEAGSKGRNTRGRGERPGNRPRQLIFGKKQDEGAEGNIAWPPKNA